MIIRRRVEEREVELTTGEIINATVRELTMKEMDDFFEIEKNTHEKILAECNSNSLNIAEQHNKNAYDVVKKITINSFVNALKQSEPRWKIITGMEDVSFIHSCFPSSLEVLEDLFVELNPLLKELKKNLQQIAELSRILEDYREKIKDEVKDELTNEIHSAQG